MHTTGGAMRFPEFSASAFQPEGPCCGKRHGGCPSSSSSWPPATAFVPVMLMGRPRPTAQCRGENNPRSRDGPAQCRGDNNPRSRDGPAQCSRGGHQPNSREEARCRHRHFPAGGPQAFHPQHLPDFMRGCLSHPEVSEAVSNLAQGLLGELFGQSPAAHPSTEEEGRQREKKEKKEEEGRQTADKRPASPSPCSPCRGRAWPKAPRTSSSSSHKEAEKAPSTQQRKKGDEEQRSAGKGAESNDPPSLWSHSLYFLRFNPNKVSARLRDGKVHIHAAHERTSGPGSCLSKLEASRVVELPPHVDPRTLTCTMRRDGTLVLQASLTPPPAGDTTPPPQDTQPLAAEGKTPLPAEDTTPENTKPLPGNTTSLPGNTTPLSGNTTPLPTAKILEDTAHGLATMQHEAEMMSPLKNSSGQDSCVGQEGGEGESLQKEEHGEGEEDMDEDKEERMEKEEKEPKTEASGGVHEEEEEEDEAERVTDSLSQREDSDSHQPMEEDDAQSPIPAAEKEDALLKEIATETWEFSRCAEEREEVEAEDMKEEGSQQAEADNADPHPITLAIVQEPEDESDDDHVEDDPHNATLTSQASTEDFVVIDAASLSPDNTAEANNVKGGEGSEPVDKTMREETERGTDPTRPFGKDDTMDITRHIVDSDGMDITQYFVEKETDPARPSTKEDTDPTRPIKRSDGAADDTLQDREPLHSTTPNQRQQPQSSHSPATPASPHHHHQHPPAAFRLSLPLVGFSADNVHASLDGRTLHISASRQARAGDAPYTERVQRELRLPAHVDAMTVRCVYLQDQGCLLITADAATTAPAQLRTVPVVAQ